jgi:hypothetical protein
MKVIVTPLDIHRVDGRAVYTDSGTPIEGTSVEVTPAFVKVDGKTVLYAQVTADTAWTGGSETPHIWNDAHGESRWTGFHVDIKEPEVPNLG